MINSFMLVLQEVLIIKKRKIMIITIPSIGAILLLILVAYLFLAAPVGSTRSLLITLINVLLIIVVVYVILSLFGIVA